MKLVIDSSVFVAAFREQEKFSREAFSILERLERDVITAIVPVIVPIEVIAAIRRRTGDEDLALRVGEHLLSISAISLIDFNTFRMTRVFDLAATSGLSGMDTIVVAVAQEFGAPLVTLDKAMSKEAQRYVKVIDILKV